MTESNVHFLESTSGGSLKEATESLLKDFREQKVENVAIIWRRGVRLDESSDPDDCMKEYFVWSKTSMLELQGLLSDLIFEISAQQRVKALIKRR